MTCKIHNKTNKNMDKLTNMIDQFYPYAKENLNINLPVVVNLVSDTKNALNPLGKTAYYAPNSNEITLFVDGRHIKDIMRSFSHELVHHSQNCYGEFDNSPTTHEGYAQTDDHLRKMEEDAYKRGNMVFRDWEDSKKTKKERFNTIKGRMLMERLIKKWCGE